MSILINNLINSTFDSALIARSLNYRLVDWFIPIEEIIETQRSVIINRDKPVWPTELERLIDSGVSAVNIFLRSPFTISETEYRYGVWYLYPNHPDDSQYMTKLLTSIIEQVDIQTLEGLVGKSTGEHYYSS